MDILSDQNTESVKYEPYPNLRILTNKIKENFKLQSYKLMETKIQPYSNKQKITYLVQVQQAAQQVEMDLEVQ